MSDIYLKLSNAEETYLIPAIPFTSGDIENVQNSIFLEKTYPIGSIYLSVSDTDPKDLFGGVWEKLEDRFLVGAGNTYSVNDTGGCNTVTLTATQIPAHRHTFTGHTMCAGGGINPNIGICFCAKYDMLPTSSRQTYTLCTDFSGGASA